MKATSLALLGLVLLTSSGCPLGPPLVTGNPAVRVDTSRGEFVIELSQEYAPISTANFLQYVQEGFYNGTLFHRVVPNFVIQGGGYLPGLVEKPTNAPIISEVDNGLKNLRGTVGMARLADDPNSATAQFYINLTDNPELDTNTAAIGYTVFGYVREGMSVVDDIATVPTGNQGDFEDVPTVDIVIRSITVEPNPPTLSPSWEAYLQQYLNNIINGLWAFFTDVLGILITGGGY